MSILKLPEELLSTTISFLAKPKDVGSCVQVSKQFQSASDSDMVWKTIAHTMYGEELASSTLDLYDGNWKTMIADDNRKGALPTLDTAKTCEWKLNGTMMSIHFDQASYYYCIISCIKWDRKNKVVRVYIDARGEQDLRSPNESSIRLMDDDGCACRESIGRFVSELGDDEEKQEQEQRHHGGHYKGVLLFQESDFDPSMDDHLKDMSGRCTFCYANRMQGSWEVDYKPVEIFKFSPAFMLADAFQKEHDGCTTTTSTSASTSTSTSTKYTSHCSPYANDCIANEEKRWGFVDKNVRKRRRPSEWWV
jgi:hypothetical protein